MTSRRGAMAAFGAALALTASPPQALRAQNAPGATLRVATVADLAVAPLYAAQAQGYFTDERLAVTATPVAGGGAAMIPALVGGDYDIGYSNAPSVALAVVHGIDLRILFASPGVTSQPPSPAALIKRADAPFATGKDLEGQRVGVNALANVQWMVVRAWIKATGGDPDKVTYVELPTQAMPSAIDSDRVACAMMNDPFMTVVLAQPQKYAVLAWPLNVVYAEVPTGFWVCTNRFVQEKAPLVQAFVHAYRRGIEWVIANSGKDAFIQLVASYTSVQPELLRKMKMPVYSSRLDTSHFARLVAIMRDNKLLTENVDLVSRVYSVQ